MPVLEEVVRRIQADHGHGAEDLAAWAVDAAWDAPLSDLPRLAAARPGMPVIATRVAEVAAARAEGTSERRWRARRERQDARLAGAASVLRSPVVTVSRSRKVRSCLASIGARVRVWAAGAEDGAAMVDDLRSAAARAVLVRGGPDAAVAGAGSAVIGCDALLADGTAWNRTGSLALAGSAKRAGIPFLVLAHTAKCTDMSLEELERLADPPGGYEAVPAASITAYVTEEGVVHAENLAAACRRWAETRGRLGRLGLKEQMDDRG